MMADTDATTRPAAVPTAPGFTVELVRSWRILCDGCGAATLVTGPHAAIQATTFYASHPRECGR